MANALSFSYYNHLLECRILYKVKSTTILVLSSMDTKETKYFKFNLKLILQYIFISLQSHWNVKLKITCDNISNIPSLT